MYIFYILRRFFLSFSFFLRILSELKKFGEIIQNHFRQLDDADDDDGGGNVSDLTNFSLTAFPLFSLVSKFSKNFVLIQRFEKNIHLIFRCSFRYGNIYIRMYIYIFDKICKNAL